MSYRTLQLSLALACVPAAALAQTQASLISSAAYGNYHAAGVVVSVGGDSDLDATVALEWRPAGGGDFLEAHPLSRIGAGTFAGSLFWLEPATSYEARVTLTDPDGVVASPTATASFATRSEALAEPGLRTLYVATIGDDDNTGTDPALPLRTIQHAADLSQPGDLVSIAPGIYRESVEVPTSGTASHPIVFRGSAPGAVLDGADEAIAAGVSWTAEGGGTYSRLTGFDTGHLVTVFGRLFRYESVVELTALGAGAPGGFHFDGTRLYVKLADGSSPELHTLHVARFEDGFVLDGRSHVRIENLEIRHFGAGDFGKGVYLRYSSDCAVRFCRIHEVGSAGVWVKGGERHLIEGSELWDSSIFGWPWDLTKGSSAENNGVAFTDEVGRGNVVRGNHIHGTFNGIGPCGGAAPPSGVTNETDVYDNRFRFHTDDALEPEGYCANVRMWSNTIEDSHMAFAVAPAAPGPTYLVRNVAYNFGNTRTSQQDGYTASALKINSGFPTPIGPLFLYHNTFLTVAPGTSAVSLLNPGSSNGIRARNNLLAGTRFALEKSNPVALDWDRDDLFTTDPARFVWWHGTAYPDLPALQAGTGQELAGLAQAPALENPAGGDFRPATASPLIDRGVPIPGINDGWSGTAPDVGAFELLPIFADGFETGDTSAWSATVP